MSKWIKQHPFIVYLIIAFGLSWSSWLVLVLTRTEPSFFNPWKLLAAFGPSLGGLVGIAATRGRAGLQHCWHRLAGFCPTLASGAVHCLA